MPRALEFDHVGPEGFTIVEAQFPVFKETAQAEGLEGRPIRETNHEIAGCALNTDRLCGATQ